MNITDFVSKANTAHFNSFRNGVFYYDISHLRSSEKYQFQIPIEDVSGCTLEANQKSVSMMRWIRKSIEEKTFIKL
jgi:hypothetical protein